MRSSASTSSYSQDSSLGNKGFSFWDALIVKAASAAGCARLLTEELNARELVDGVVIENPF